MRFASRASLNGMSSELRSPRPQRTREGMAPSPATYGLLPGAGGDSWYWHLVAPKLQARGHEVLTPDLPADDDSAGLGEYTEAVVSVLGGRSELIVVAQSLAAFVAPMLCERVEVRLLVLVAPMIPSPGESPGAWWSNTGQTTARRRQDEREGRDPDAEFDVMTTFMHDVPQEVVAEAFARGEPRQSETPFAEPWPLEAWPSVPTRVLAGRYDRLFPLEFMRRLARERLGIEADVIDTGHLPALSRPEDLVRRLEAYRVQNAGPTV
jgi:pimeloyl-ACP methyl ester carboxylesterase